MAGVYGCFEVSVRSNNPTFKALVSRSVCSKKARELIEEGQNIGSLSKLKPKELEALGLSAVSIQQLQKTRPPVPTATTTSVIFRSRSTCCICRQPGREYILHHIKEWSVSRDHSEENLVLLCLEDHGRVHTKHELSQNISPELLQKAKSEWENMVRIDDVRAIQDAVRESDMGHSWFYINHPRIFDLAISNGIDLVGNPHFADMRNLGLVSKAGLPTWGELETNDHAYMHGAAMVQYAYVAFVIDELLETLRFYNASDYLEKTVVRHAMREGDIVFLQGAWAFGDAKGGAALGNHRKATRTVGDVTIYAEFDDWHATSTSAWGVWLRHTQNIGCLLKIRTAEEFGGNIRFDCTLLGVAYGLWKLKTKAYGNYG